MQDVTAKILVVEPDPDTVEILVAALSYRLDAQLTCVADAESCLDTDMIEPHDLVIAETILPDCTGMDLAERLLALRNRPIILMAEDPEVGDAVEAMRLGVRDLFAKPFAVGELVESAERALRGHQIHRQHAAKYRRMRDLVRRVISERRSLNRRVELICRDLVGAQRRLVHRVLEAEQAQPSAKS